MLTFEITEAQSLVTMQYTHSGKYRGYHNVGLWKWPCHHYTQCTTIVDVHTHWGVVYLQYPYVYRDQYCTNMEIECPILLYETGHCSVYNNVDWRRDRRFEVFIVQRLAFVRCYHYTIVDWHCVYLVCFNTKVDRCSWFITVGDYYYSR